MEGRGLSDLFRNTSEEIFLKAMMENSMGVAAAPSMEMLGFRNMSESFREDSEELFNSWLTNEEARILKLTCHSFLCFKGEIVRVSQDRVPFAQSQDHSLLPPSLKVHNNIFVSYLFMVFLANKKA
jgi:hypothetical protein